MGKSGGSGGGGRGGGRGGGGRTISRTKRNLQKRNKLVKKGKLKPNTTRKQVSSAATNAAEQQRQGTKRPRPTNDEDPAEYLERKRREEDEVYDDMVNEMMDSEDVDFIVRQFGSSSASVAAAEEKGGRTFGSDAQSTVAGDRKAALLPIKMKDGSIISGRAPNVADDDDGDDDGDGGDDGAGGVGGGGDGAGGGGEEESGPKEKLGVAQLMARRKLLLRERKTQIGSIAFNFLENPEERIQLLEKLISMMVEKEESVKVSVVKLVSLSVLEIFKNTIPAYKILDANALDPNVKLKKDTYKLQRYESALVSCYKTFLVKLESLVSVGRKQQFRDRGLLAVHAVKCLADLLVACSHFNFAENIMSLVVPLSNNSQLTIRTIVCDALRTVFKADKRGEVSLKILRIVNRILKSEKKKIFPEVLETFLCLRIGKEVAGRDEGPVHKKQKQESKKEKKQRKRLAKVEKEMLEAKGEENVKMKERFFADVTALLFTVIFRILKSSTRSVLLRPVLQVLAKFSHTINLDFCEDLLSVLSALTSQQREDSAPDAERLSLQEKLLCVQTTFSILSGPGASLTLDPARYFANLYANMLRVDLNAAAATDLAVQAVADLFSKWKKKVTPGRTLAFAKRFVLMLLQMDEQPLLAAEAALARMLATNVGLEVLFQNEEFGQGIYSALPIDPEHAHAHNAVVWELDLLERHFCPDARRAAEQLVKKAFTDDGASQASSSVVRRFAATSGPSTSGCALSIAALAAPAKPTKSSRRRAGGGGRASGSDDDAVWDAIAAAASGCAFA